jgi:hypothetical protein
MGVLGAAITGGHGVATTGGRGLATTAVVGAAGVVDGVEAITITAAMDTTAVDTDITTDPSH